jgi:hypothetical protein
MPSKPVWAAAEGMPTEEITRRTILTGLGAAAAASVTLRKAESAGLGEAGGSSVEKEAHMNMIVNRTQFEVPVNNPDAELIRLGNELDRLRPIYHAVGEELGTCQKRWIEECDRRGVSLQSDCDNGWAIYHELGAKEIEARYDPLADRFNELNEAVLAAVPATLAGLAVKARAVRLDCTSCRTDTEPTEAEYKAMDDWIEEMIIRFVVDVERLAGARVAAA